jgi:hypothetical protein
MEVLHLHLIQKTILITDSSNKKETDMRKSLSWSNDDIEVQDHYIEIENYEALAIFHAECASQLMLNQKPEKGVFYNTTPFGLVEAQIHAQLSTTFAIIAQTKAGVGL